MESDPNGIIKFPLMALKILGRHPKMNPTLNVLAAAFYMTVLIYLFIVTLLQYSNINGDVYKFANNFEGTTAYLQMSGKVIFTITHRKRMIELLNDMKYFWDIDICDGKVKEHLKSLLENTRTILKVFFVCVVATELLIVMAPFFTKDIAVGAWTLDNYPTLFRLTLILQEVILFFIFTSFTFAMDCVFLVMFIYVIVQFRILNYCLRNITCTNVNDTETRIRHMETLKAYIEYHQFLMTYSKKFQKLVSPVMLIEYFTTTVLFCTEMYMFIDSNSIQESIRRPISFCAVLFQLSFYCVPADIVASESLLISDALYHSDWTSKYITDTRKAIPFILQRAQQPLAFSAGGLADMTTGTLINVVKVSWSVCTILRVVKTKTT